MENIKSLDKSHKASDIDKITQKHKEKQNKLMSRLYQIFPAENTNPYWAKIKKIYKICPSMLTFPFHLVHHLEDLLNWSDRGCIAACCQSQNKGNLGACQGPPFI